jgi:tetratricopeptide (TPR) repeat protein
VLFKSGQALDDIDKAIEMRDTAIARGFRLIVDAEIMGRAGQRDPALAERALAGIQEAKRRLPDNKWVRRTSLIIHLGVAGVYDETNQSEKRKAALEEAGRDAQELKGITNCSYVMARVHYFEQIGNNEAALQELEEASRLPETSDLVARYALVLYEQGRDAEALRVLNDGLRLKPDNAAGQMLRIILWAGDPDVGHKEAYQRYLALMQERKREGKWTPYDSMPLMLFGKKKEAADLMKDFRPALPWAKYLAGELPEEEILKPAGKNPLLLIFSHFEVGLARLADGDRKGAREHFEKAVATRFYAAMIYPHARAFLARLKRDPEWPKWIPVKK